MRICDYAPLDKGGSVIERANLALDLEKIFKESDYISVHVPKNEQTVNMIDTEQIGMMKPTVRLVNCARGGIINEDAIYDALMKNRIAGVALDVYPKEPPENTWFTEPWSPMSGLQKDRVAAE